MHAASGGYFSCDFSLGGEMILRCTRKEAIRPASAKGSRRDAERHAGERHECR